MTCKAFFADFQAVPDSYPAGHAEVIDDVEHFFVSGDKEEVAGRLRVKSRPVGASYASIRPWDGVAICVDFSQRCVIFA